MFLDRSERLVYKRCTCVVKRGARIGPVVKVNKYSPSFFLLCKYTYLHLASAFVEGMTVCRTQASVVMREFTTGAQLRLTYLGAGGQITWSKVNVGR